MFGYSRDYRNSVIIFQGGVTGASDVNSEPCRNREERDLDDDSSIEVAKARSGVERRVERVVGLL